jgi:hypothetical protein
LETFTAVTRTGRASGGYNHHICGSRNRRRIAGGFGLCDRDDV